MGRTLVIDTATAACSVALIEDGAVVASRHEVVGRGHAERLVPMIAELPEWGAGDTPEAPVVLVAHGGVIAAMTAALLDLPVANWPVFGGLANTSWVQLSGHGLPGEKPRWRLDVWNASAEVADAGVLERSHVHADLMGATGLEMNLEQRGETMRLQGLVVGDRCLAVLTHGELPVRGV